MTNSLTFPNPERQERRSRPPQDADRRGRTRRFGRDHESGLRGDRDAVRPNRRSDHLNRAAAVGTASRKPLSGFSSGVRKAQLSFGPIRFSGLRRHDGGERVATGFRWAEGPVYFAAGRYVLFSDIPNNRIMRFSEDDGHLSVYRQPR